MPGRPPPRAARRACYAVPRTWSLMETLLEVHDLVKVFRGTRAVDGVSFAIPRGRIVGLLGPNGAGKTTTIHMLLGLTTPTAGRITYFGQDFATHRQVCLQRINFASSYNTLQGRITVAQNLIVFGHLYGIRRPDAKIRKWRSEEH